MAKHDALRAFLIEAIPELARHPDRLLIYMTGGRLVSRIGDNLGFEYRARMQVDVLDFTGEPAQFFLPFLLWVRRHEPAVLQSHDRAERDLQFEIDILDGGAVDISIVMPMSEAVDVLPQPDGTFDMTIRDEPPIIDTGSIDPTALPDDPIVLLKRILHGGQLLVGTPGD